MVIRKYFTQNSSKQQRESLAYEDWEDGKLIYWYYRDVDLNEQFVPAYGYQFDDEGQDLDPKTSPMYGLTPVGTTQLSQE
ncbi:hypothetical protein V4836_08180 [Kluyvera ascorbata]|uniref:Uncharacterized protein n=1 Tax=Kluyvera ascorbata TaxID=51288 RepID=A0AB35X4F2_9ENTR